jgi:hypothetical protein
MMIVPSAMYGQSLAAEQPRFQIEIQVGGEGGPRYTVTNLTGKPVTACVFQLSSPSQSHGKSKTVWTVWDAVLQDEQPMEPGGSISQYLSHIIGNPLPDNVDVVAGVWADGETFGDSIWVKNILETREMRASAYEHAATVLQQGLDQNWTRDQYLQAISDKPNSGAIIAIRSTLQANHQFAEKPQLLRGAVQVRLESFRQKIRTDSEGRPTTSAATPG